MIMLINFNACIYIYVASAIDQLKGYYGIHKNHNVLVNSYHMASWCGIKICGSVVGFSTAKVKSIKYIRIVSNNCTASNFNLPNF